MGSSRNSDFDKVYDKALQENFCEILKGTGRDQSRETSIWYVAKIGAIVPNAVSATRAEAPSEGAACNIV